MNAPQQIARLADIIDKAGGFSETVKCTGGPYEEHLMRQKMRSRLLRAADAAIDFMLNEARSP